MDRDIQFKVGVFYSEEDEGWIAEESETGIYVVESDPFQAIITLGMILPEDPYEFLEE